ncbi:DUF6112 family protein [Leucobacter ruminantium]|nr:DUF6112 family protein [Leucobacter ruminantium]
MRRGAEVSPDFSVVDQATGLAGMVGALMTFALIVAVMMLIVSALLWAIGSATGNYQGAARGRTGVLVALLGAICAGGALAWANFLLDTGDSL